MKHNLVVIEVKPVTVKDRINELKEDFTTLKWFLDNANYYRAIMLIYGNVNGNLPESIREEIKNISDERILIMWHSQPYREPEIIINESESYIA